MTTTAEHTAEGLTIDDTVVEEDYTIGCLSIPDRRGDMRIMWDSRNEDEVKVAKKMFDDARKKGMAVYKAEGKDGHRGSEVLTEFDPKAERLVAMKPMAGG